MARDLGESCSFGVSVYMTHDRENESLLNLCALTLKHDSGFYAETGLARVINENLSHNNMVDVAE